MRKSGVPALAGALLALAIAPPQPSIAEVGERNALIDRAIEHHGGEVYEASRTRLELCSASGCSQLEVVMDRGVFELLVEGKVRDGRRKVRFTNDEVEAWLDGSPIEVGDTAAAQRFRDWAMAKVYFCFLPYRLNDPGVFKEDLGTEIWDGRELRRIKVTFAAGESTDSQDEYTYWLAPDTGQVEMFAYSYETGGGGLRFRRGFNYRRVGGILFFDQENWGTEGEDLSVDLLTPTFVADELRRVSTVELREITVEPLD